MSSQLAIAYRGKPGHGVCNFCRLEGEPVRTFSFAQPTSASVPGLLVLVAELCPECASVPVQVAKLMVERMATAWTKVQRRKLPPDDECLGEFSPPEAP